MQIDEHNVHRNRKTEKTSGKITTKNNNNESLTLKTNRLSDIFLFS